MKTLNRMIGSEREEMHGGQGLSGMDRSGTSYRAGI